MGRRTLVTICYEVASLYEYTVSSIHSQLFSTIEFLVASSESSILWTVFRPQFPVRIFSRILFSSREIFGLHLSLEPAVLLSKFLRQIHHLTRKCFWSRASYSCEGIYGTLFRFIMKQFVP